MTDPALEQYLTEAASWDADRAAMCARSERSAWRIAIGAGMLCSAAVVALMGLMPLKRVEPFVIRVDNSTGIVDVVPAYAGARDPGEAVTRYFLEHYVTTCERFNFATAESDYEECASFHASARNQRWAAQWDRANPDSPLNLHKDGSTVQARVSAITFFKRGSGVGDLAQVRYVKVQRSAGASGDRITHWIATVQYVYAKPPSDDRIRHWNPLGFRIIEFQVERENVTTADAPATKSASKGAGEAGGRSP